MPSSYARTACTPSSRVSNSRPERFARRCRVKPRPTTALQSELQLRLSNHPGNPFRDRAHLFALAARAMRQIVLDHARQASGAAARPIMPTSRRLIPRPRPPSRRSV
ncbi:MAG: ECF-type sigma factor, partial [Rhodanobacteraceae bacterium]